MAAIVFPDPSATPFTDPNGDIWDYNASKTRWARRPAPLAAVATSGAYADLSGLPTLGTAAATASTDYAAASHTHVSADVTDSVSDGNTVANRGKLLKTDGTGLLEVRTLEAGFIKDSSSDRTLDIDDLQSIPIVVSASQTAVLGEYYHNVASATYTDPTPSEGEGFTVLVINGTATVGGTGYSTAGTLIKRVYHSGSWQTNYVYLNKAQMDALYLALTGNQTVAGNKTFSGSTTLSGGVAGDVAFDTNTLFVDSVNNRVGIGTVSPSRTLYVSGNIESSGFSVFPQIYCDVFKDSSPGNDALNLSARSLIGSDGSAVQLSWGTAGSLTSTANFSTTKTIKAGAYTVSTLPTPSTGMRCYVTDSTATTFYSIVAGGGANVVPVFYNGTNWVIA